MRCRGGKFFLVGWVRGKGVGRSFDLGVFVVGIGSLGNFR